MNRTRSETPLAFALPGLGDPDRIDVDTDPSGAVLLGGGRDDPSVAAAEVVDHVVFRDGGHAEHLGHDVLGVAT